MDSLIVIIFLIVWWLIGFIGLTIYEKITKNKIIDSNVNSYYLKAKMMFSFLSFISIIIVLVNKNFNNID